MTPSLLTIEDLVVAYPEGAGPGRQAVSGVSFQIKRGESLGLVGESGCGKSTLAKAIMQFIKPLSGQIRFGPDDLARLDKLRLQQRRPKVQMIFQDSLSALNPRRTVGATIAMPLKLSGVTSRSERMKRVSQMMQQVGLNPSLHELLPYQLSGGQCQRVQIARALITRPALLVCDEPVSALDVSIQAQIINLLNQLREKTGLTLVFISHDLAVVKYISDRIAVMYAGKLCEVSNSEPLYQAPLHPYSKILLEAVPTIGKHKKADLDLDIPVACAHEYQDRGCRFRGRCPRAKPRCSDEEPELVPISQEGWVACHYPLSISDKQDPHL